MVVVGAPLTWGCCWLFCRVELWTDELCLQEEKGKGGRLALRNSPSTSGSILIFCYVNKINLALASHNGLQGFFLFSSLLFFFFFSLFS